MQRVEVSMAMGAGLHARPADRFVRAAQSFRSNVTLRYGERSANGKAIVELLVLGAPAGARVVLEVEGDDEAEAAATLAAILTAPASATASAPEPEPEPLPAPATAPASASAPASAPATAPASAPATAPATATAPASAPEPEPEPLPAPAPATVRKDFTAKTPRAPKGTEETFSLSDLGVLGALAVDLSPAPALVTARAWIARAPNSAGRVGTQSIREAIDQVRAELMRLAAEVEHSAGTDSAAIFTAQEALLDGESGIAAAVGRKIANGLRPDAAVNEARDEIATRFASAPNEQIRAKVNDVREIAGRILAALNAEVQSVPTPPGPWVFVTRHLDTAVVANARTLGIVGFITTALSPLAHAAILARALTLPVRIIAESELDEIRDGEPVELSPEAGAPVTEKSPSRRPIALRANVASLAEAHEALMRGADGIGLIRTELLFAAHRQAPTVDEQVALYERFLLDFGNHPVTFRLFDAGGDKAVAFLPGPAEPRGIARLRAHPDLLASQLAALSRLPRKRIRILVPFVEAPGDLDVGIDGVSIGAMIESLPGVAAAPAIAARAAFVSIGTNDLTGAVTGRPRDALSPRDALDPAVRRAIAAIATAAKMAGREITICGEAATLPEAIDDFLSLGVDALSVSPLRFPDVARYLTSK